MNLVEGRNITFSLTLGRRTGFLKVYKLQKQLLWVKSIQSALLQSDNTVTKREDRFIHKGAFFFSSGISSSGLASIGLYNSYSR